MVNVDDRKREQLAGSEDNVFQQMLNDVTDFAMNMLGLNKPKDVDAPAQENQLLEKAKELASNSIKGVVDTGDQVLKSLKLDENEMVASMQKQAKDFLKQMGLLEEEFENEDYY